MRRIMICLVPLALLTSAAIAQNALPPQPPRTVDGQTIETLVKQAAAMPRDLLEKLKNEINDKGETIAAPPQPQQ